MARTTTSHAALAVLGCLLPGWMAGTAAAAGFERILRNPLADPVVMRRGDYWYVTGSDTCIFAGRRLTRHHLRRHELSLDFGEHANPRPAGIWGLSFYQHTDGAWHAYVTVHFGHFQTAVAHFVPLPGQKWAPGKPITRWRLRKLLIGGRTRAEGTAYDQKLYRLADGSLYLVYNAPAPGKRDVGIYAARMKDPATLDASATPVPLLVPEGYRSESRHGTALQICEGSTIRRLGGKWVLAYSVGAFDLPNYKIGLAYSDTFLPPRGKTYRKVLIDDPKGVWGKAAKRQEVCYLLQSQKPDWPNYCGEWIHSPGIGNIVEEDGRFWLVHHGYVPVPGARRYDPTSRMVFKLPLRVAIDPARPMHEWIAPVLPEEQP